MEPRPLRATNHTDPTSHGNGQKGISFEAHGSWQTSHLPKLVPDDLRVLLDFMYCWFHQKEYHPPKNCNWPLLWEYLDRHGLSGVTGALCLDSLCELPHEIEAQATRKFFTNNLFYEKARRCLTRTQKAAKELKIPVIVLKGPALIFQGYDDPGTRQFTDIDIFTDSLESFYQLQKAVEATPLQTTATQSLFGKVEECEFASYVLDDWEHEFRYPLDPPGEPMFDVLLGNQEKLQIIPQRPEDIITPDPSVHLVFLIQHMAVNHLFSRFFWFLDLAVLVRKNREKMDFEWIEFELDRIGQTNAAAVASDFCRQYIDPDYPVFAKKLPAWNYSTIQNLAVPENIVNGRFGTHHKNRWDKFMGYLFGMVSYYLIEDPKKTLFSIGFGTHWTMYRLKRAVGITFNHWIAGIIMGTLIGSITYPLARIIAPLTRLKNKRARLRMNF